LSLDPVETAGALLPAPPGYRLTRFVFLRLLGAVYFVAFLSAWRQVVPLVGARGLLPARLLLERLRGAGLGFGDLPSLFWIDISDSALRAGCAAGLALSAAVALGLTNALAMLALWGLYLSLVHVGQIFYSFGWEILLLETGLVAAFLCPVTGWRPLAGRAPPTAPVWLLRWILFRVMFGAGLIKIRGDACWRDLTCLIYHYETQPLPNPLSWWLHQAPPEFHKAGVLFNHFVELIVPWMLFWPRRVAIVAGVLEMVFQGTLILSGNLSWLNWLTLALCVACFDDRALARVLPARWAAASDAPAASRAARAAAWAWTAVVVVLSVAPVANLLSDEQAMNTSFDRLHLVNTYGAFGSVGRERNEVILEGTDAALPDERARWREYAFPCKPGDPMRRPCVIAPYQPRVDWEIWFAAMASPERHPWLVRLVAQLLRNDAGALSLLDSNPFPDAPPRFIRASLWRYRFTRRGEPGWWRRERLGEYLPPLSLDDPRLGEFLRIRRLPDEDEPDE
jgi:hypothetical protein